MNENVFPVVIISKTRGDKRAIWIKRVNDVGGIQLRYVLFDEQRWCDAIDANGTLFKNVKVVPVGVSWNSYSPAGLFGIIVAIFSTIFLTVLVDYKIEFHEAGVKIDLSEAKSLILMSARARGLESDMKHHELFVRRISSAKSFEGLFKVAARWWE